MNILLLAGLQRQKASTFAEGTSFALSHSMEKTR